MMKFDTCEPFKDISEEQESIPNCKVMFKFLTEGLITSWSGNILDIAQAICTRSNRVLGFVHQYCVHLLMKDFCRAANSCKASLIVGAPRVACNGLCTAARFHSAMITLDASCSAHFSGTSERVSPTAILKNLLLHIGIRSDRLCIFLSGLLNAFVTEFHLRRTHQGHGLNFNELMHGRIQMMTALCLALAHTHQTMCWGFST